MPNVTKEKMLADELRKQRKLGEQMADVEFQMDIAPLLGYVGEIDPSIARFHGIGGESGPVTTKGFHIPDEDPNNPYTREQLRPFNVNLGDYQGSVPKEPGTVNVVGADSATPEVWAHEYRHRQFPEGGEKANRLADAANANNESEWNAAVRMWRDQMRREGEKPSMSEAEVNLIQKLQGWSGSDRSGAAHQAYNDEKLLGAKATNESPWYRQEEDQYAREQTDIKYWNKRRRDLAEFDEWTQELKDRNDERDRLKNGS